MTQNITTVGIAVTPVTAQELEDQDKEDVKRRYQKKGEVDSLEITKGKAGVAHSAEAPGPSKGKPAGGPAKGSHEGLVAKKTNLENVLKEAGVKTTPKMIEGEKILAVTEQALETIAAELENFAETDGPSTTSAATPEGFSQKKLVQLQERLTKARDEYQSEYLSVAALQPALEEVAVISENSQAASVAAGEDGDAPTVISPEEAQVWKKLEPQVAKAFGIKISGKEQNWENFRTKLEEHLGKELKSIKVRESEIKVRVEELKAAIKKAGPDSSKIQEIKKEAEALSQEMKTLAVKKAELQKNVTESHALIEQGLRMRTERELGIAPVKSAAQSQVLKAQSATQEAQGSGAPAMLGAQSAGGDAAASGSSPAVGSASGSGGGFLHAASAEGGTDGLANADLGSQSANVPMVGTMGSDFSGVSLSIASQTMSMKSEAKKTDQAVKKLLAAALSGNWEAIKSALILLNKKASMLMIGIGAQTIKSMQYYEKQMGVLSKSIGQLDSKSSDYSGKLAQINSQMNQYSLNRQSISNFLRDAMTMREEMASVLQSINQKESQIINKTT